METGESGRREAVDDADEDLDIAGHRVGPQIQLYQTTQHERGRLYGGQVADRESTTEQDQMFDVQGPHGGQVTEGHQQVVLAEVDRLERLDAFEAGREVVDHRVWSGPVHAVVREVQSGQLFES